MRRLAAVAALVVGTALLGGPLFATEIDLKKKTEDEKKEATATAKPGEPAKPPAAAPAPAPACAPTAEAQKTAGTAGFFKTVEDIYGFEGSVAALTAPTPAVAAPAAPAAKPAPAPAPAPEAKDKKKAD